jgi:folate-binding protein YgfZ
VQQHGRDTIIARDNTRIECWLHTDSPLLQQLAPNHDEIALTHWQALDIQQGQGWVCAASTDMFTPQMLNLQNPAINGISFTKGCYTGQEIVARLHYKGKLKRHMYLFEYSDARPTTLQIGADLYSHGSETTAGKKIGQVVNVATLDTTLEPAHRTDSTIVLLACVTDGAFANDEVFLDPQGNNKLLPQVLPYAITNEA